MRHRYKSWIALATCCLLSTCLPSCSDTSGNGTTSAGKERPVSISEFRLPDSLSFCGESVPLWDVEVRERAEREFYINLQTPGQILLYLKRSGRYFPMFDSHLQSATMPSDLKYVSVAESALFMARSPKDAVGLWQFIPGTARELGLVVNEEVDERRNPTLSTQAALKYLMQGYQSSKSWTNAVAGYNMGHGSLHENMHYQGSTNYYDLFLNEETSRYVLRIVIIKHLMENAADYGVTVSKPDRYVEPQTRSISIRDRIPNLAEWAKMNGTTYKQVKLLNPWILKRNLPAPPNGRHWEVLIPT